MSNSENVRVATTGAIYIGPTSAAAPTASDSTLAPSFVELGYANSDGISFSPERSTNAITAWQNAAMVREVITESNVSYTFTLMETNQSVLETYYGTEMIDGVIDFAPGKTGGRKSFVIDILDDDKVIRHYIPNGEIINIGEQSFQNGEAIQYEVTITAYDVNGVSVRMFFSEYELGL